MEDKRETAFGLDRRAALLDSATWSALRVRKFSWLAIKDTLQEIATNIAAAQQVIECHANGTSIVDQEMFRATARLLGAVQNAQLHLAAAVSKKRLEI